MADFDAELGNDVVDETDGRAEQAAAGNNVVTCSQEGKKTPPGADIPVEVATARSAPSNAAMRFSKAAVVGLAVRV